MYDDDEDTGWQPPPPTAADFRLLGRIADRRAAIEAVVPADRQDEARRRRLLAILDRMEEALCVHGHAAAAAEIEAGWTELAACEALLRRGVPPRGVPPRDGHGEPRESAPEEAHRGGERAGWRDYAAELERRLDELQAAGLASRPEGQVFLDAFRAFRPLGDPDWWRSHPPRKLNAKARRRLRELDKKRRRRARRTADGEEDFRLRLYDAIALYTRAGDGRGLERCLRLADAFAAVET